MSCCSVFFFFLVCFCFDYSAISAPFPFSFPSASSLLPLDFRSASAWLPLSPIRFLLGFRTYSAKLSLGFCSAFAHKDFP